LSPGEEIQGFRQAFCRGLADQQLLLRGFGVSHNC
jgi:hypothetical protein